MVIKSWVESIRGNRAMRSIDQTLFGSWARGIVTRLLPHCNVTIAAHPDNGDDVLGFKVTQGPYMHLTYVRAPWRRKGIAKRLLGETWDSSRTVLTWWTRDVHDWAWEKWPGMKFVPVYMLDQPGSSDGRDQVSVQ